MQQFRNDRAIYLQLVDIFRHKILQGEWARDHRIPSVRDLALEWGVNPNTIQRALALLEDQGLLRSERTLGRFVNHDEHTLEILKQKNIQTLTKAYVEKMKQLGISAEHCINTIKNNWED